METIIYIVKNGQLKNRITQGDDLIAGSILDINTSNNTIIFAGMAKKRAQTLVTPIIIRRI